MIQTRKVESISYKNIKKLDSERTESKRYCKCGHSVVFPKTSKRDKVICNHCGYYIFKNDFLEFQYRIKEKSSK